MGDTMRGGIVRSVIWWIYYGLFLGLCIFIFIMVIKYAMDLGFMSGRKLNLAQILYGMAIGIMIFGLLSMSIAYLARNIWYRLKRERSYQETKHHPTLGKIKTDTPALQRAKGEKLEQEIHHQLPSRCNSD